MERDQSSIPATNWEGSKCPLTGEKAHIVRPAQSREERPYAQKCRTKAAQPPRGRSEAAPEGGATLCQLKDPEKAKQDFQKHGSVGVGVGWSGRGGRARAQDCGGRQVFSKQPADKCWTVLTPHNSHVPRAWYVSKNTVFKRKQERAERGNEGGKGREVEGESSGKTAEDQVNTAKERSQNFLQSEKLT